MIANTSSGHGNFGAAIGYVAKQEKADQIIARNLTGTEISEVIEEMALEVEKVNEGRPKQEKITTPVYHVQLSWAETDNPSVDDQMAVGRAYLEHMGLEDYQAVIVNHRDTSHAHIHIVANRVHPGTGETWKKYLYRGEGNHRRIEKTHYQRVEEFLRQTERRHGWHVTPGRFAGQWEKQFDGKALTQGEYHFKQKAEQTAKALGIPDADTRPIKVRAAEIKDDLYRANSFKELDGKLAEKGLYLKAKGQGAVISDGSYSVKASNISRGLSGPALEEKFRESLKNYCADRNARVDPEADKARVQSFMVRSQENIGAAVAAQSDSIVKAHQGGIQTLENFKRSVDTPRRAFQRQIAMGYHNPKQAYNRIDDYSKKFSLQEAMEELWQNPERFGTVADRNQIKMASESIGTFSNNMKQYSTELRGKSDGERAKMLHFHRTAHASWKNLQSQAIGLTNHATSQRGSKPEGVRGVESVIGTAQAARQVAANPSSAPLAGAQKLLSKARGQMQSEGERAAGRIMSGAMSGTIKGGRTAAQLLTNPTSGSVRLMQQVLSGGVRAAGRGAREIQKGF